MAKSFGVGVGVVAILSLGVLALERSAAQQMPRDRTATEQRSSDRASFDRKIAELERTAAERPADAAAQHVIATFYYEKTRDQSISADDRRDYIARGLEAEDRALQINPDYVEALVYKNILLRTKALTEPDPAVKEALIREADALRNRALELRKAGAVAPIRGGHRRHTRSAAASATAAPGRNRRPDRVGLRGHRFHGGRAVAGQDQGRAPHLRPDGHRQRRQGRGRCRSHCRCPWQSGAAACGEDPADADAGDDRRRAPVGIRSGDGRCRRVSSLPSRPTSRLRHGNSHYRHPSTVPRAQHESIARRLPTESEFVSLIEFQPESTETRDSSLESRADGLLSVAACHESMALVRQADWDQDPLLAIGLRS